MTALLLYTFIMAANSMDYIWSGLCSYCLQKCCRSISADDKADDTSLVVNSGKRGNTCCKHLKWPCMASNTTFPTLIYNEALLFLGVPVDQVALFRVLLCNVCQICFFNVTRRLSGAVRQHIRPKILAWSLYTHGQHRAS